MYLAQDVKIKKYMSDKYGAINISEWKSLDDASGPKETCVFYNNDIENHYRVILNTATCVAHIYKKLESLDC